MDNELRRLERLALNGDPVAITRLKRLWLRLNLVPSNEDLARMRCGFAQGNIDAIPIFILIWQHILNQLLSNQLLYPISTDPLLPLQIRALRQKISLLSQVPISDDYLSVLFQLLMHPIAEINEYLDEQEMPPILLLHNDVTQALIISFLNPNRDHPRDQAGTTNRNPTKLYTTLRYTNRVPGNWEVDLSWNVGDLYNPITLEYETPASRDTVCLPFFSELPCLLQENPVWHAWGWGDCDLTSSRYGTFNYDPIKRDLDSTYWIHRADLA